MESEGSREKSGGKREVVQRERKRGRDREEGRQGMS